MLPNELATEVQALSIVKVASPVYEPPCVLALTAGVDLEAVVIEGVLADRHGDGATRLLEERERTGNSLFVCRVDELHRVAPAGFQLERPQRDDLRLPAAVDRIHAIRVCADEDRLQRTAPDEAGVSHVGGVVAYAGAIDEPQCRPEVCADLLEHEIAAPRLVGKIERQCNRIVIARGAGETAHLIRTSPDFRAGAGCA